jgi:DNA-binding FrmR family transcriptional regulator
MKKEKSLKLTKQAQGTISKVIKMLERDEYCPNVIQQLNSVCGLLKRAKRELLGGHLDSCIMKKMKENKTEAIDELLKIYNLSN